MEYTKGGVRYLITGGAGAELLTKNSYYHYMISNFGNLNKITVVELPSPSNTYLARYSATLQLFAGAMYDENPAAVVFVISGLVLLALLLVIKIFMWKKRPLGILSKWIVDTVRYAFRHFKELFAK